MNYLKTKLTEKPLRQICGVNKVPAKPAFQNDEKLLLNVSTRNIYQLDSRQTCFVDWLTAVSAAHFDVNTAILGQTVQN